VKNIPGTRDVAGSREAMIQTSGLEKIYPGPRLRGSERTKAP